MYIFLFYQPTYLQCAHIAYLNTTPEIWAGEDTGRGEESRRLTEPFLHLAIFSCTVIRWPERPSLILKSGKSRFPPESQFVHRSPPETNKPQLFPH